MNPGKSYIQLSKMDIVTKITVKNKEEQRIEAERQWLLDFVIRAKFDVRELLKKAGESSMAVEDKFDVIIQKLRRM